MVELNEKNLKIYEELDFIKNAKNVILIGGVATGKTTILEHFIVDSMDQYTTNQRRFVFLDFKLDGLRKYRKKQYCDMYSDDSNKSEVIDLLNYLNGIYEYRIKHLDKLDKEAELFLCVDELMDYEIDGDKPIGKIINKISKDSNKVKMYFVLTSQLAKSFKNIKKDNNFVVINLE